MPARARGRRALVAIAAVVLLAPAGAVGADCEGDECQVPPAAPDDPVPATAAVQGPPNPPVRFPKPRKQKQQKKKQDGRDSSRGAR